MCSETEISPGLSGWTEREVVSEILALAIVVQRFIQYNGRL